MKLVVGLGNPGAQYAATRHNLGFRAVDLIAAHLGTDIRRPWMRSLIGQGHCRDEKIILAKPQTYMNLSGVAVAGLMRWYKLGPADLTVIYDDLDLPPGAVRIRPGGGAGGHRGLVSIIGELGTKEFLRVRIGIGRPAVSGYDVADWVLGRPAPDEQNLMEPVLQMIPEIMETIWQKGAAAAMNKYNQGPTV